LACTSIHIPQLPKFSYHHNQKLFSIGPHFSRLTIHDLESLSSEFQFVEFVRRVREFVSQHPHVEVVRFKSAILDLQRRLAGQNRDLCQFAEANGLAKAKQDAQLEGPRGVIDEIAKKQLHEREKVSGLQKVMGEVQVRSIKQMRPWNGGLDYWSRPLSNWRRQRIECLGSNQMSQVCERQWQTAARGSGGPAGGCGSEGPALGLAKGEEGDGDSKGLKSLISDAQSSVSGKMVAVHHMKARSDQYDLKQ
jgi:hypothetical protein